MNIFKSNAQNSIKNEKVVTVRVITLVCCFPAELIGAFELVFCCSPCRLFPALISVVFSHNRRLFAAENLG